MLASVHNLLMTSFCALIAALSLITAKTIVDAEPSFVAFLDEAVNLSASCVPLLGAAVSALVVSGMPGA